MLSFKNIIAACGLLLMTACSDISVAPLVDAGDDRLSGVHVVEVSGREGQLFSRQLREKLYLQGMAEPEYDLVSTISVSSSSTLSVRGASSTLKKMTMSVAIKLIDRSNGDIVLKENISAGATLGAVTSYFGQDESERNGKARLARLLADRTARRVQLYFITADS